MVHSSPTGPIMGSDIFYESQATQMTTFGRNKLSPASPLCFASMIESGSECKECKIYIKGRILIHTSKGGPGILSSVRVAATSWNCLLATSHACGSPKFRYSLQRGLFNAPKQLHVVSSCQPSIEYEYVHIHGKLYSINYM